MQGLESLYLRNNQIRDVALLANLTNLNGVNLGGNSISSLSGLSDLKQLQWLTLDNNRVTDLAPFSRALPGKPTCTQC